MGCLKHCPLGSEIREKHTRAHGLSLSCVTRQQYSTTKGARVLGLEVGQDTKAQVGSTSPRFPPQTTQGTRQAGAGTAPNSSGCVSLSAGKCPLGSGKDPKLRQGENQTSICFLLGYILQSAWKRDGMVAGPWPGLRLLSVPMSAQGKSFPEPQNRVTTLSF